MTIQIVGCEEEEEIFINMRQRGFIETRDPLLPETQLLVYMIIQGQWATLPLNYTLGYRCYRTFQVPQNLHPHEAFQDHLLQ